MTDPQPRLGIAGKSGWPRMKATETEVAGQLRQFLLSGKVSNTTVTDGANHDRQVLGLVGAQFPKAVAALGCPSILALTRALGPGTCSWCAAAMIAAGDHEPAPDLDSAAHRALLGTPCRRCLTRHQATQVADREASHLDQVVAAGLRPQAAARLRTSAEVQRHAAAVRKLAQSPRPVAPTGVMWSANQPQPESVTAALTAALGPRPPVPSYYTPYPNRRRPGS
jgi:hypothetical protein